MRRTTAACPVADRRARVTTCRWNCTSRGRPKMPASGVAGASRPRRLPDESLAEDFVCRCGPGVRARDVGGAATGFEFSVGRRGVDRGRLATRRCNASRGRESIRDFRVVGRTRRVWARRSPRRTPRRPRGGIYFDPQDDEFRLGPEAVVRPEKCSSRCNGALGVSSVVTVNSLGSSRAHGEGFGFARRLRASCAVGVAAVEAFDVHEPGVVGRIVLVDARGTNACRQPFEASASTRCESGSLRGSTRK